MCCCVDKGINSPCYCLVLHSRMPRRISGTEHKKMAWSGVLPCSLWGRQSWDHGTLLFSNLEISARIKTGCKAEAAKPGWLSRAQVWESSGGRMTGSCKKRVRRSRARPIKAREEQQSGTQEMRKDPHQSTLSAETWKCQRNGDNPQVFQRTWDRNSISLLISNVTN